MKKLILGMAAAMLLVSTVARADVISERRAMMKNKNQEAVKVLIQTVKGQIAYDPATVVQAFKTMRDGTDGFEKLFPPDSKTGGDTLASPAIWQDKAAFDAAVAKFHSDLNAAIDAKPQDMAAFMPLFQQVTSNCQSCHEKFRLNKK